MQTRSFSFFFSQFEQKESKTNKAAPQYWVAISPLPLRVNQYAFHNSCPKLARQIKMGQDRAHLQNDTCNFNKHLVIGPPIATRRAWESAFALNIHVDIQSLVPKKH